MPVEDCISLKFIRRDAIFNSEKEVNLFYEFMDAVYSTPNRNASAAFKNIKGYQDLFKATNVDPRMKIHEISSKQILEMFKLYYSG
jgi:16S rRNA A1518/A1519 N6-dimethyltransferase RsmA/KsgA/DIM1 with predicted DNA glycosylase/AP lyase activity